MELEASTGPYRIFEDADSIVSYLVPEPAGLFIGGDGTEYRALSESPGLQRGCVWTLLSVEFFHGYQVRGWQCLLLVVCVS